MSRVRLSRSWLTAAVFALVFVFPLHPQAPPAAAAEIVQQCTGSVTHVVQRGETLASTAARYRVSTTAIMRANQLSNPNRIEVGQALVIPVCGNPAPPPQANSTQQTVHIVQRGETLASIAGRYRVSVNALMRANGLSNPNRIEVGQRLVIPSSGNAGTPQGTMPSGPKRIEVDLTKQWMYAYEGNRLVLSSGVSTGRPKWETPVGRFRVYAKLPLQTMDGEAQGEKWSVPDVPHVMYIFRNVALHGTYWHNAFGSGARLSHGCVNLPLGVAERLYNWAPIGTPVWVHH